PYSELRKAINSPTPPHECIICPGRGWFRPEPCANRLIPGIHDRQFGTGWFETEEYQGEFYRWAREKSVFFIRGAGPGVLQVEIHTVWDEGTTQTISIQVDNEPARTVHFSFGERRKTVLPVYNTKTLHAVTLRGDVWRPVTTVPGQQDPRALSVMFYGARLDPMPEIVEFEHGIRLIGWEIQSGDDATVRVKLFWDIPPDLKGNFGVFIHGFPAPVAIRPIELLAHELRRRRKSMASRFQADDVMVRSQHTGELARQTCILQKPGNSHGSYLLYLGIRDHTTGRRVRVVHTGRPVYRSAIELGMIRA
ncbi:MAG TPA: hypothetical protein PLV45_06180, partial [bacterium]|nr:hypothetical protein [bacterium]